MTLDLGDREVSSLTCDACGQQYKRVVIFATRDDDAYAVVNVVCHGHDREVWLDATFGSWVEPYSDHVSFSCRVSEAGAGLVDGPVARTKRLPHHGAHLTRERALSDARLALLWPVVDEVVTTVPEVSEAVYSAP